MSLHLDYDDSDAREHMHRDRYRGVGEKRPFSDDSNGGGPAVKKINVNIGASVVMSLMPRPSPDERRRGGRRGQGVVTPIGSVVIAKTGVKK